MNKLPISSPSNARNRQRSGKEDSQPAETRSDRFIFLRSVITIGLVIGAACIAWNTENDFVAALVLLGTAAIGGYIMTRQP